MARALGTRPLMARIHRGERFVGMSKRQPILRELECRTEFLRSTALDGFQ